MILDFDFFPPPRKTIQYLSGNDLKIWRKEYDSPWLFVTLPGFFPSRKNRDFLGASILECVFVGWYFYAFHRGKSPPSSSSSLYIFGTTNPGVDRYLICKWEPTIPCRELGDEGLVPFCTTIWVWIFFVSLFPTTLTKQNPSLIIQVFVVNYKPYPIGSCMVYLYTWTYIWLFYVVFNGKIW